MSNRWTKKEDVELLSIYPNHSKKEIETIIKKPWASIKRRAHRLNIKRNQDIINEDRKIRGPRSDRWTKKEDALLEKIFKDNTQKFIESKFNRSWRAIINRAQSKGLKRNQDTIIKDRLETFNKNTHPNEWTEEEKTLLKEKYKDTPKEELLKLIKRSWVSIRKKALEMGIKRSSEVIKKDNIEGTKKAILKKYDVKYSTLLPSMQEKSRQTNRKRKGVEYPTQDFNVREKVKKTIQKKYNVDNVFQSKIIKEKIKRTNLKKYGVENPIKNKEIKEKYEKTNLDKYGVSNPFQLVDKVQNGMLKKYGDITPLRVPEIMKKKKKTSLERYGFEIASKNLEVRKKLSKTLNTDSVKEKKYQTMKKNRDSLNISIEEKIFLNYLKIIDPQIRHQQLHPKINHIIDFYSPMYNLWIQYDGVYWHGKNYHERQGPQSKAIKRIMNNDAFQNRSIPNLIRFWSDEVTEAINNNSIYNLIEKKINEKKPSVSNLFVCHQYLKKIEHYTEDLKTLPFNPDNLKASNFIMAAEEMSLDIVNFITKYEWLKTVGIYPKWCFTARYQNKLGGVVLINDPYSYSTILGSNTPKYEALIQRGATASWTPKNLGSKLLMFSCKWMVRHTEKRAFIGYADPSAKEIGIIYQACNFDYIGDNFGNNYLYEHPDINRLFTHQYLRKTSSFKKWCLRNNIKTQKEWFKENGFKNLKKIPEDIRNKWLLWIKKIISESKKIPINKKMKYVLVLPKNKTEKKELNKLKTYKSLPYVKYFKISHPSIEKISNYKVNHGKTSNRKNPEKIKYIIENHYKMSRSEIAKNINESLRWVKRQIGTLIKEKKIRPKR